MNHHSPLVELLAKCRFSQLLDLVEQFKRSTTDVLEQHFSEIGEALPSCCALQPLRRVKQVHENGSEECFQKWTLRSRNPDEEKNKTGCNALAKKGAKERACRHIVTVLSRRKYLTSPKNKNELNLLVRLVRCECIDLF